MSDLVLAEPSVRDELEAIKREYVGGTALREAALYRLYRIWERGSWMELCNDEGVPLYSNWGEFLVGEIRELGISRATIYSRLRLYSVLTWLGYDEEQMVTMVMNRPTLVDRVVNMLVSWNTRDNSLRALKFDVAEGEERNAVREILDEAYAHMDVEDAVKHVAVDVKKQADVSLFFDAEGDLHLMYEDDGVLWSAHYVAQHVVPDRVRQEVCRRYRIGGCGE